MKKISEIHPFLIKSYLLRNTNNPIIQKIIIKKFGSFKKYYESNQEQTGGTNSITISYNGELFNFYENIPNYWTLHDVKDYECIHIGIDPESHQAYINNINADTTKCGETIMTKQGSHLLKIALQFLKENKTRFNINKITLTDNAKKYCKPGLVYKKNVNLATFLTLLTGDTWYGKYGFRPCDEIGKKYYEYNKKIMLRTTINDIDFNKILNKILKYKHKNEITEEQYKYIMMTYDNYAPVNPLVKDLLMVIFRTRKYDMNCGAFNVIYGDLLKILKLKINHLHSTMYELHI